VPEKAGRKSAIVLEKENKVACAAECGRVVTNPNTSRVTRRSTGTETPGSHQSV
jgi:hypothetical protein